MYNSTTSKLVDKSRLEWPYYIQLLSNHLTTTTEIEKASQATQATLSTSLLQLDTGRASFKQTVARDTCECVRTHVFAHSAYLACEDLPSPTDQRLGKLSLYIIVSVHLTSVQFSHVGSEVWD